MCTFLCLIFSCFRVNAVPKDSPEDPLRPPPLTPPPRCGSPLPLPLPHAVGEGNLRLSLPSPAERSEERRGEGPGVRAFSPAARGGVSGGASEPSAKLLITPAIGLREVGGRRLRRIRRRVRRAGKEAEHGRRQGVVLVQRRKPQRQFD